MAENNFECTNNASPTSPITKTELEEEDEVKEKLLGASKDKAVIISSTEQELSPSITEDGASTKGSSSKSGEERCCRYCSPSLPQQWSPLTLIFLLSFLGHWGDRKWMFTAGVILIHITPNSMRLIGLYYACTSVFIILLAAPVGVWIDRTPRLRAALCCLVAQNLSVALSGFCFLVVLQSPDYVSSMPWLVWSLVGVAIVSAGAGGVSSSGAQTCLTKDWLVEVCDRSSHKLAKSNAVIRAVDLGTEVLSPAFAGWVMAVFSVSVGAVIIVVWNLASLCLEGLLYYRIWRLCPALQQAKSLPPKSVRAGSEGCFLSARRKAGRWSASWRQYMTHPIRSAGLALAFLYMTVLAFDNYSRAYLFESGVNEAMLGLFTSMSSLPGLLGSVLFPRLRNRFGVERVGLLGFCWLSACLTLCVASVFAPGSLFYLINDSNNNNSSIDVLQQLPASAALQQNSNVSSVEVGFLNDNSVALDLFKQAGNFSVTDTLQPLSLGNGNTSSVSAEAPPAAVSSYCSVGLLLTGIIVSRFGLWTADLSVVQSMQELAAPSQRGALNGVQAALNMFFDLFRSLLLIAFPRMDTFGYLIIASFVFVFMGLLSYCHFYAQRRALKTEEREEEEGRKEIEKERENVEQQKLKEMNEDMNVLQEDAKKQDETIIDEIH